MNKRTISILASLATILALCVAIIALVPAFGQWLFPRPPITSSEPASPTQENDTLPKVTEPPSLTSETDIESLPTSIPSDTPIPDTPPGTVLEVGQTWRQGGLELRLDKGEVTIGDEYREHGPGVLIGFSLTNRRPQKITFQITQENFFASDNRGRQLEVGKVNPFYGYYFAPPMDDVPINLQSGEHIELYYDYDAFFVRDDITDPSVTEIIIGATGISSINNARWRIPIFH